MSSHSILFCLHSYLLIRNEQGNIIVTRVAPLKRWLAGIGGDSTQTARELLQRKRD